MRADCIFCGFESYGVDGLKAHSATCNLHPLAAERDQLRADNKRLDKLSEEATEKLHEATIRLLDATVRAEAAESDAAKCREEYKSLYAQVSDVMRERGEAQQLLRELAEILNPHDPYDPSKLPGWARDTVERAREAEVALAHAADLRRELSVIYEGATTQLAEPRDHGNDQYALFHIATIAESVFARTPAQSLGQLKAVVLREHAKILLSLAKSGAGTYSVAYNSGIADAAVRLRSEADRLEKEGGDA